jgi:hypothetical protein
MNAKVWPENLKRGRPFGRLKLRWYDNIRMDLKEMMWQIMGWIYLARD